MTTAAPTRATDGVLRWFRSANSTPWPFLLALLTVVAVASTAEIFLRRNPLRGVPLLAVVADSLDEATEIMHEVANASRDTVPAVVLLGGSALRDAVEESPAFEARLRSAFGRPVHFYRLTVQRESMSESLALATSLTAPPGSVVLVHMSALRLATPADEFAAELSRPRLPFLDYSVAASVTTTGRALVREPMLVRARPWLAYMANRRIAAAFGNCASAIPHLKWLKCAPRFSPSMLWHPIDQLRIPPSRSGALSNAAKTEYAWSYRAQLLTLSDSDFALGTSITARLLRLGQERQWHMRLLLLPVDPLGADAEAVKDRELDASLRQLVQADSIMDLRQLALPADVFHDLHHLLPAGRAVMSATLAQRLSGMEPRPGGRP